MSDVDVGLRNGTLDVNERFGPTCQGEGPSTGRLCVFVRLARCNLDCGEGAGASWKCDTPFTWRWDGRFDDSRPTFNPATETHPTPIGDLVRWVVSKRAPLCVISGGEPLAQRAGVAQLARDLANVDVDTEVETNGTISPGPAVEPVTAFNVSPKLANSGVALDKRYKPAVLTALAATGKARFKFVCSTPADLDEVQWVVDDAVLPDRHVWIMPAGTTADQVIGTLRTLAEPTIAHGWNLTSRLHVETWGDVRGV